MIVIEICRTSSNWSRVYKNMRAYNSGKMWFETASEPGRDSRSATRIAMHTIKIMKEIYWRVRLTGHDARDFVLIVIDQDEMGNTMPEKIITIKA